MKLRSAKSSDKPLKLARKIFLISLMASGLFMPELLWHKFSLIVHVLYEGISFILEESLIHGLGLRKQYAQMTVFYFFWLLGLWLSYRLWKHLPHLLQSLKSNLLAMALQIKSYTTETWLTLTVWQKIKFLLFPLAGLAGGFMILLA